MASTRAVADRKTSYPAVAPPRPAERIPDAPAPSLESARFGHDFSRVSIHTDVRDEAAEGLGVLTEAPGSDLDFGAVLQRQPAPTGGTDPTGMDQAQLRRAALLEQAAHQLTYEKFDDKGQWINPGKAGTKDAEDALQKHRFAEKLMQESGYSVSSRPVEGDDHFGMRTFMPNQGPDGKYQSGVAPIVAFRGTDGVDDYMDDANPDGIGMTKLHSKKNQEIIAAQLATVRQAQQEQHVPGATFTGHSLGGALAQNVAADHPDVVGDITTFQSARVNSDVADRMKAINAGRETHGEAPINSQHFRTEADLVFRAGQDMTPGRVTTFPMSEPDKKGGESFVGRFDERAPAYQGWLANHMAMPLTNYATQQGALPAQVSGEAQPGGGPGTPVANPYNAPGGQTFNATADGAHRITTSTTEADKTRLERSEFGIPEMARSNLGLVNIPYEGAKWAGRRGGEAYTGVREAGAGAISWTGGKAGEVAEGLQRTGAGALSWAGGKAGEAGSGTVEAATGAYNWGAGKAGQVQAGVGGFVDQARQWDSVGGAVRGVGGGIRDGFGWGLDTGKEAVSGMGNAIAGAFGWGLNTGKEAAGGTVQAVKQGAGWTAETGVEAAHGVASAGGQAGQWLGGVGGDLGAGVRQMEDWRLKALQNRQAVPVHAAERVILGPGEREQ